MTDKNLADECERVAYAMYRRSMGVGYTDEFCREGWEDKPAMRARWMNLAGVAIAALRASAAPQLAENGFDVDLFTLCRRTYIRRVFPEIGERAIVSIANEAASAAAQAVAAGQAARAKRDVEIALAEELTNVPPDVHPDVLTLVHATVRATSKSIAAAIGKDAAG